MKSFGMWYQEQNNQNLGHKSPKFDLHVNFWSLEDIKTSSGVREPYLDIGIKIENYKQLECLTFFCPFEVDAKEIEDLSEKMSLKDNANIIFNDDCEIETKDNYTIVQMPDEQRLLAFPLFTGMKGICTVEKSTECGETRIVFDFQKFHEYVREVDKLKDLEIIYIRFRIKDVELRDHIYFDNEPLNKSFESAFSGTRIIDFKVNEKRNIPDSIRTEIIVNREKWVEFGNIHFLAMMPSSYNLTPLCEERMTCRELEQELWDDYLGTKIDFSKGHVLAYHWRKKATEEKTIEDFSCLMKVDYSKTKLVTIIAYALSVVALGMVGSLLANIWKGNIGFGIAAVLLLVAVAIGKKK